MRTAPFRWPAVLALVVFAAPGARAQDAREASPNAEEPPIATESMMRVTWQQALDRAFAVNPSIATARQEIERASGLVREARAAWLPKLIGNGSYTRIDSARVFAGTVATPATVWNGNLDLRVPLFSPRDWSEDIHQQDNREVARAGAFDERRQLGLAVGRAYLTVLLEHSEVEVAIRARQNSLAHYDYAHTRLVMGLGNGVDDARAEQELRTNEAQVKNTLTALVRAQSALAVLLSTDVLVDATDEVALGAASSPADAIADARARRADVHLLEAQRTVTAHQRRDDWVFYAPTLLADAMAYRETETVLTPAKGWQVQLVLAIPFYDGGFRYGIQRERNAADAESRIRLEALLRQVSVEVRTAFAVVHNSDESLQSSRAAAAAAVTAAALADKSYRAGASTNIEVIDAERQARDAESQVALAEDAAREARLDLLVATGAFP